MKVIVFGAGISGLTVAHELVKKGFSVEIYEKDILGGGMAKSIRNKDNVPTEHSWRGYAPFYYNLFQTIKEISLNTSDVFVKEGFNEYTMDDIKLHNTLDDLWTVYENEVFDITEFVKEHPGGNIILKAGGKDLKDIWDENGVDWHMNNSSILKKLRSYKIGNLVEGYGEKSVYDNLNKNRLNFEFLYNDKGKRGEPGLSSRDYLYLLFIFGKVICSNRRKSDYFKVRLDPLIKKNLSKEGYHFIADFLAGPGYGFDKNTMSLGHYATFIEYILYEKEKDWQVMSMPTSEAWINPWIDYLKSKGVKFNFSSELIKINHKDNIISDCVIRTNNKNIVISADDYVIAINPFNLNTILKVSNLMDMSIKYDKLNIINNQISFRLGFGKKIKFNKLNSGYVLIDSPYNITFYPQEDNWDKGVDLGMGGKIKTLLSGTIILPYNSGSLTNSSALSLSLDKLKDEIVHQFFESSEFMSILKDSDVKREDIIFREIYSDWYKDGKYLKSKNSKWVNNFINEEYRPLQSTKFNNMFISGGHCRTSINIWSMEGSVESGKITSNLILEKYNKGICKVYRHESKLWVKLLGKIDDIFYMLHFKNIIVELLFLLIFIICIKYI
jgi:cytochrome b involved in lipid metabolism